MGDKASPAASAFQYGSQRPLREVQPSAIVPQGSGTSSGTQGTPARGLTKGSAWLSGVLNGNGVSRGIGTSPTDLEKQRLRRTESERSLAIMQCLLCSSCITLDENMQYDRSRRAACSKCRQRSGELAEASRRGDVDGVQSCLLTGASPRFRDDSGWTPLHYGAAGGHTEVCRILLEALDGNGGTADVNAALPDGSTALMLAVDEAHIEVARLLLDKGAASESKDEDGFTALNRCDECVREEFESCLMPRGVLA